MELFVVPPDQTWLLKTVLVNGTNPVNSSVRVNYSNPSGNPINVVRLFDLGGDQAIAIGVNIALDAGCHLRAEVSPTLGLVVVATHGSKLQGVAP